jgi:anti-sigma regulatory factor (Ser/Thr protein kinase)
VLEAAGFLERHGVGRESGLTAQLVLEEIVTNIARYAFEAGASREVRVHLSVDTTWIFLTVEDDGRPFNPLQDAPVPDTETPLEDRPVGGLGLHLVKEMVGRLEYEREGETNRVHMRVELDRETDRV